MHTLRRCPRSSGLAWRMLGAWCGGAAGTRQDTRRPPSRTRPRPRPRCQTRCACHSYKVNLRSHQRRLRLWPARAPARAGWGCSAPVPPRPPRQLPAPRPAPHRCRRHPYARLWHAGAHARRAAQAQQRSTGAARAFSRADLGSGEGVGPSGVLGRWPWAPAGGLTLRNPGCGLCTGRRRRCRRCWARQCRAWHKHSMRLSRRGPPCRTAGQAAAAAERPEAGRDRPR